MPTWLHLELDSAVDNIKQHDAQMSDFNFVYKSSQHEMYRNHCNSVVLALLANKSQHEGLQDQNKENFIHLQSKHPLAQLMVIVVHID